LRFLEFSQFTNCDVQATYELCQVPNLKKFDLVHNVCMKMYIYVLDPKLISKAFNGSPIIFERFSWMGVNLTVFGLYLKSNATGNIHYFYEGSKIAIRKK
jgi:hypothetical protein